MALNYVTVTGTFNDGTGTAQTGVVIFTPSQTVYASGIPVVSAGVPVNAEILAGALKNNAGGALQLLATDNSGLTFGTPTGFFFWTVTVQITGNQPQAPWSFFLPHTPSTVDLTALANTAAGGGGFSSPMTTLGDLIYENATPAAARLAGNTTAAKQFLTQTGTGSVSAAPAWAAFAPGDLPVVTFTYGSSGAVPSAGTYTAGSVAIDQNNILRACTAGGSPGTWARAGQQPHQFYVDDYGAKGDGKVVGDVVTNATTTVTSATAGFTSGDAGKHVLVNGAAGATAVPLMTTIASFTNSTTVVLASGATASASACQMVWGTDDTAAINNAVAAAKTFALAGTWMAEVIFSAKIYVLSSGPTQTGNGSSTITYNSQIPVPYPGTGTTVSQTARKLTFKFTGSGSAGNTVFWDSTTPNMAGTALVSMTTAPSTPDATFGVQSVIGGPTSTAGFTGGSGVSGAFCDTYAVITDISVWCPCYTNQTAFDLSHLAQMYVDRCSAQIVSVPGYDGGASPLLKDIWTQGVMLTLIGAGMRTPVGGNNAAIDCPFFSVQGYTFGVWVSDHVTFDRLTTVYTVTAVRVDLHSGAGTCHNTTIQNFDCEATINGISTVGDGGILPVYINMDCETASGSVNFDIYDPTNALYGQVNWTDPSDNRSPVINGAAHLKVINNFIGSGHMASPPSIPATTVAAALVYRDAWVVITSGGAAVSAITVDGTATGLTLGASGSVTVRVPAGKTIALTYASTAPTWAWWLD